MAKSRRSKIGKTLNILVYRVVNRDIFAFMNFNSEFD